MALLASTQPALGETSGEEVAEINGRGGQGAAVAERRLSSVEEGLARLPWKEEGYLSWEYDGHKINYVDEGPKDKVGFGG